MSIPTRALTAVAVAGAAVLVGCSSATTTVSSPSTGGSTTAATSSPTGAQSIDVASSGAEPSAGVSASVVATPAPTAGTSSPSPQSDGSASSSPTVSSSASGSAENLVCQKPSAALVARVVAYFDPNRGPVTKASMVRAGTNPKTGTWYVVAVERGRVNDKGVSMPGHSVGAGLTNAESFVDAPRVLPLGASGTGSTPTLSWRNVSWTGAQLEQGKQAAMKALACVGH